MNEAKHIEFYAPNSAHQLNPPDPEHGIEEEWMASVRDGNAEERVVGHGLGPTYSAAIERAALFASAPDLLAACERLLVQIPAGGYSVEQAAAVNGAEAAIAKANGNEVTAC